VSQASARAIHLRLAGQRHQAFSRARLRLNWVRTGFIAATALVAMRLVDLAILERINPDMQSATAALALPARADIVDRRGELLARSIQMPVLAARPGDVLEPARAAAEIVRVLPELDFRTVRAKLASKHKFVYIKRRITPAEVVKLNAIGDPGLLLQSEPDRLYPNRMLASHALGYVDIDGKGLSGIERARDTRLSADTGRAVPLRLTIDSQVQIALEDELGRAMTKHSAIGAAGIVLDATNGEIMAMASLPAYDPNATARIDDNARFNRATLGVYELGSIFKGFNVGIGLDTHRITLDRRYNATHALHVGRRMRIDDFKPQRRWLTVPEVLVHSSNIASAQIAEEIGAETQRRYFKALGLLDPLPIELGERGTPLAPRPWGPVETMTVGFGHGISVTPLHLASALAALVNGGVYHPPHLLVNDDESQLSRRVFSPATSQTMRGLLRLVVVRGTGKKADVPGYRVGGKTGTAEKVVNGRYVRKALISTFAGVFPIDAPRYVVIAALDEPKPTKDTYGYATAGWVSAPIVHNLILRTGPMLGVKPDMTRDIDLTPLEALLQNQRKSLSE